MTSRQIAVPTTDGDMPAHLWRPESGTGPGLLLLQEIFGISRYIEQRARDLADLGHVVLAPEIYWRLGVARVLEGPDALTEAVGLMQRVDWPAAVADGSAALDLLRSRPETGGTAGIVGFCFGGGLGFNVAAVNDPDVLVSYYGSAIPGLLELAPQVTAPSLHHFGLSDSYLDAATVEKVREIVSRQADVVFETYDGADHAFDNPDFIFHNADAAALAWQRTTAFLRERLPVA